VENPEVTADALESVLALTRAQLAAVSDDDQRKRRAEAIDQLSQYVRLLRDATSTALRRYCFKLEFPDGRWNVDERELPTAPQVGDLVQFADGCNWRVRRSQLVRPRPQSKPAHEYFVCVPA
jgi:hypothetical protein